MGVTGQVASSAIPCSDLGHTTGRFHLGDANPFLVMKCYFDGSQGIDDYGHEWITLAGFVAADKFWGDFQTKWEAMLLDRYPIAPYLHMNPLLGRDDPFERVVGWTDDRAHKLINDAVDLLQKCDKSAFRLIACTVDLTACRRMLDENSRPIHDAGIICTRQCVQAAWNWYLENHKFEFGFVFFDRGEQFIHDFRAKWNLLRAPKGKVGVNPFWDTIADVQEVDMTYHPPVQAADLVAWSHSRQLSERSRPFKYLADVLRKVVPCSILELDEDDLRGDNS